MRALCRFGRAEDGAGAVEFAIIVPILMSVFFGIFEFGRALWTQGVLDYAVEQAARCASINTTTCSSVSTIQTFAAAQTTPLNLATSIFTVTTPTCGHQVAASYPFAFVATGLFSYSLTLTSTSCYPI
jgi:Flp pilus assembly protein TadG